MPTKAETDALIARGWRVDDDGWWWWGTFDYPYSFLGRTYREAVATSDKMDREKRKQAEVKP